MPSVLSRPVQAEKGQASPSAGCSGGWRDVAAVGLSLLNDICLRAARPFEELTEDLLEAATALVPGHADSARGGRLASLELEPLSKASGSQTAGLLNRAAVPLLELSEDAGPGGTLALLATLGPTASAAAGGKALLALCGLSVHTKGLYAMLSLAMAGGAWSMWNRHPEEEDRTLQRRSAAALLLSSAANLALAMGYGIPPSLPFHVANPDVVARLLPDVVIVPMIIMNLGYLAGKRAEQMLPTMGFGFLSSVSLVAAAASAEGEALPLLAAGLTCMCKAAFDIDRVLPVHAGSVSAVNKLRSQISADLMVFAWVGYPLVQGLGMANCITLSGELHALVALDLVGKLGVTHIVLRSQEAYLNAQRALANNAVRVP